MKIVREEIEPMVRILMNNHDVCRDGALEMIEDMNNGHLKELASKVRKEKMEKKKDLPRRFGVEFGKMKTRRVCQKKRNILSDHRNPNSFL